MSDSNNNKVDFSKILRVNGYLLPIDEKEVEQFESNCDMNEDKPKDWDNPTKIIERGKIKKVDLPTPVVRQDVQENLSMVARQGSGISDEVRKKMNEDRTKAKK